LGLILEDFSEEVVGHLWDLKGCLELLFGLVEVVGVAAEVAIEVGAE